MKTFLIIISNGETVLHGAESQEKCEQWLREEYPGLAWSIIVSY